MRWHRRRSCPSVAAAPQHTCPPAGAVACHGDNARHRRRLLWRWRTCPACPPPEARAPAAAPPARWASPKPHPPCSSLCTPARPTAAVHAAQLRLRPRRPAWPAVPQPRRASRPPWPFVAPPRRRQVPRTFCLAPRCSARPGTPTPLRRRASRAGSTWLPPWPPRRAAAHCAPRPPLLRPPARAPPRRRLPPCPPSPPAHPWTPARRRPPARAPPP
mmetsp:Transcript_17370/g.53815  ORF Transcript_17370/g.53815 Transcript_17370/m.53815 type:complete len:216 (-) Transcript_17370:443-1090(-)